MRVHVLNALLVQHRPRTVAELQAAHFPMYYRHVATTDPEEPSIEAVLDEVIAAIAQQFPGVPVNPPPGHGADNDEVMVLVAVANAGPAPVHAAPANGHALPEPNEDAAAMPEQQEMDE